MNSTGIPVSRAISLPPITRSLKGTLSKTLSNTGINAARYFSVVLLPVQPTVNGGVVRYSIWQSYVMASMVVGMIWTFPPSRFA